MKRAHAVDLWSVSPKLAAELMEACVEVGSAVRNALAPDGICWKDSGAISFPSSFSHRTPLE
jgi:hypothetical protein